MVSCATTAALGVGNMVAFSLAAQHPQRVTSRADGRAGARRRTLAARIFMRNAVHAALCCSELGAPSFCGPTMLKDGSGGGAFAGV